jgi:thiosulfate/3-mercaptopyruvate sulfurtransferase
MKQVLRAVLLLMMMAPFCAWAASLDTKYQITPEELLKQLQSGKAPLILNVGPQRLYDQAHIKGAEYMGAGSTPEGIAKLKDRVKSLPKSAAIVLYCGCCPWEHCPNVDPAFATLQQMGFTNAKVMYSAHNIGSDWVDKGYPVEKGK